MHRGSAHICGRECEKGPPGCMCCERGVWAGLGCLEWLRDGHLGITMYLFTFQKCLASWFIGCIADADPKPIVH